jgi:ribose 5-phosphate isomerase A
LADRVKTEGLRIQGVPTSTRTADLARKLGLDVVSLDQAGNLDITIDGTDEFDRALNLIKGGGGALLQEKIVASASDRMIVIADFDKQVPHLGKFPLPVEVLGFGLASSREHIARLLADHGLVDRDITMRMQGDAPFVTDEGNFILDLHLEQIPDAPALAIALNQVPGVVENGLFINICDRVILGASDGRIEEHVRS